MGLQRSEHNMVQSAMMSPARRLALAAALFWALLGSAAAQSGGQPVVCTQTFQVSQGAVALTKIVSGVAGKTITICGYVGNAGAAAGTFQLQYGTGTNCGTSTTALTPAFALGINGVLVDHGANLGNITLPQQTGGVITDLCLVTTGTGPVQFLLYYGVF